MLMAFADAITVRSAREYAIDDDCGEPDSQT